MVLSITSPLGLFIPPSSFSLPLFLTLLLCIAPLLSLLFCFLSSSLRIFCLPLYLPLRLSSSVSPSTCLSVPPLSCLLFISLLSPCIYLSLLTIQYPHKDFQWTLFLVPTVSKGTEKGTIDSRGGLCFHLSLPKQSGSYLNSLSLSQLSVSAGSILHRNGYSIELALIVVAV